LLIFADTAKEKEKKEKNLVLATGVLKSAAHTILTAQAPYSQSSLRKNPKFFSEF
jgi:hypothetical protein